MPYCRIPYEFPKYDVHATEHWRDGVLECITEQKRKHKHTNAETLKDPIARQRKFNMFASLVRGGRHDMACYIYYLS